MEYVFRGQDQLRAFAAVVTIVMRRELTE